MSGLHRFTHAMHGLEVWMFNNPRKVLAAIALLTLLFALRIPGLRRPRRRRTRSNAALHVSPASATTSAA